MLEQRLKIASDLQVRKALAKLQTVQPQLIKSVYSQDKAMKLFNASEQI